jgi:uncharacterized membrane protein
MITLLAILHGFIVYSAIETSRGEAPPDIRRLMALLIGTLFMAIGSQVHKVRSNFMFGIRTPWTLSDERVWERTHRLGRWICVTGGLVLVLAGVVVPDPRMLSRLTISVPLGIAITLVIASYVLRRLSKHDRGRGL